MKAPENLESRIYVDGRWMRGEGGIRPVISPTTGAVFAEVTDASVEQAKLAIAAAKSAQPAWARKSPLERAQIMKRIAMLVRRDSERLAQIIVHEQGKPINEARGEVGGTAEFFDYFAEFARRGRCQLS